MRETRGQRRKAGSNFVRRNGYLEAQEKR